MRSLAALVVAAGTALALAAPATAKELTLTVCGAEECTTLVDPRALRPLASLAQRIEAPAAAPFYAATLRAAGSAGTVRVFVYVPAAGAMRIDDATSFWTPVPARLRPVLAEATRGLEPYPAATASGDRVPVVPALAAAVAAIGLVAAALRRARRPLTATYTGP